jgi:hypothetical protein
MKQIIQNSGLIIFVIAIVLLIIGLLQDMTSNTILLVSGILIIAGLFLYVILNKILM